MKPKAKRASQSADSISPMPHGHFLIPNESSMPIHDAVTTKIATNSMGMIKQRLFVVVYTLRHDVVRIISARKANQREVRYYENSTYDD